MGLEPTRAEHNGLAVHRLNHSATSSRYNEENVHKKILLKLTALCKVTKWDTWALVRHNGSF